MKKVAFLLLAVMLLLNAAIGVSAQTVEERPIYGKVTYESNLSEFPVEDGSAGGTLPDGTDITVTDAPEGTLTLVVNKIDQSETEPYAWFRQVLDRPDDPMQAYEIYFLDGDENRIPAGSAVVTLGIPYDMEQTEVHSVTPAGGKAELSAAMMGGAITFTTDGSHYYVLTGKSFEQYRDTILDTIDQLHDPEEDDVRKDRIDEAYQQVEDYDYDPEKSFEENKDELDQILEDLKDDLDDLEDFEDYRDKVLDAIEDLHESDEDAGRKELIDQAEQAVKDYEYDFDKSLEENEDALYDILQELCKELGIDKVPDIPKTGDDAALTLWFLLATGSFTAFLVLLIISRRKKEEDEVHTHAVF